LRRKPRDAFEKRVATLLSLRMRRSIVQPVAHCVTAPACHLFRLRLGGGSFGLLPSSSESKLRSVSATPGTGSAPRLKNSSRFFLKRYARFLHYSNEWKRSQRCDPKIHKIPTWKSLGNRGEDLGTSDRRNRMGKRFRRSSGFSNAIFPLSSSLLRSQIILDPVSLLQTSDAAQNPVEEQPLWSRFTFCVWDTWASHFKPRSGRQNKAHGQAGAGRW